MYVCSHVREIGRWKYGIRHEKNIFGKCVVVGKFKPYQSYPKQPKHNPKKPKEAQEKPNNIEM